MASTPAQINLFKNKEIPFFDKFINWTLNIGRLIVIATEIIAIAAFIYRFSLDERLSNLKSSIKQKQAFVALFKNDENKYRNLQDRLSLIAEFANKGNKTYKIFQDIIGFTPQDIKFNNLALTNDRIYINLNVVSTSSLSNFINKLKNYSGIKVVSIDNIENKALTGLVVSVTALF